MNSYMVSAFEQLLGARNSNYKEADANDTAEVDDHPQHNEANQPFQSGDFDYGCLNDGNDPPDEDTNIQVPEVRKGCLNQQNENGSGKGTVEVEADVNDIAESGDYSYGNLDDGNDPADDDANIQLNEMRKAGLNQHDETCNTGGNLPIGDKGNTDSGAGQCTVEVDVVPEHNVTDLHLDSHDQGTNIQVNEVSTAVTETESGNGGRGINHENVNTESGSGIIDQGVPNFSLGIDKQCHSKSTCLADKERETGTSIDEEFPYVSVPESLLHKFTAVITPEQRARQRNPSKVHMDPYTTKFGSSEESRLQLVRRRVCTIKHPFISAIGTPVGMDLDDKFAKWVDRRARKNHPVYADNVNLLKTAFEFGVYTVTKKEWFHHLNYTDYHLDESHMNVILYYIRKKAKYDPSITIRFTTTDCFFDATIREFYTEYSAKGRLSSIVNDGHVIVEYIKGYFMRCNTPWWLVDDVLFPIKVVDEWHWILGRLSFKDRCIYAYDNKPADPHYNTAVIQAVEPYCVVIPLFLASIGFYGSRTDVKSFTYVFDEKVVSNPFDAYFIEKIPDLGAKNCSVYATAFAEYYVEGHDTLPTEIDIELARQRYTALLWEYGSAKQKQRAESDIEFI